MCSESTASPARIRTRSRCAAIRTRLRAQAEGKFDDEIVPVEVETVSPNGNGKPKAAKTLFNKDEGPRADTSLEALAKLKPVFHAQGTVTAGNSSQTSDGAAAALVMSDKKARELGLKPMARFVELRGGRRAAGDHGHRPGGGDSEGAGAGRAEAGRHRPDRVERGLRRAGAGGDPRRRASIWKRST